MTRIYIIFFLTCTVSLFGQDNFKKEIDSIYNFHPHLLKRQEQEKLFPMLDQFFTKIGSDTTKYLPLLREELKSNDHFPYFYYDCSHLLMITSKSMSDKRLCAEAFTKCSVADLDPKIYVILIKSLANDGIDITKAALKILDDPEFSFVIPEHAMTFMQGYCLMYCLLPLDPAAYVDTLIEAFPKTKDVNSQKSIITTLWFTYSCSGDKFLQSLDKTNTLTKEVSEYSKRLLSNESMEREYKSMLKSITADELTQIKKSALSRFSDEAISELDFVTKARRQKFNCN